MVRAWKARGSNPSQVRVLSPPPRYTWHLVRSTHRLMRIIFLNTLEGKISDKFFEFVAKEESSTDIFCFQEMPPKLFDLVSPVLKNFNGFNFTKKYIEPWSFFQATYIKKWIEVKSVVNNFLQTGAGLSTVINYKNRDINILNIHGVAMPGDKFDSEERLAQSQQIVNFAKEVDSPTIIGGDFNLLPETKSIGMFEDVGYTNLIKEFDIKQTRNEVGWDFFKDHEGFVKQYFADYAFVSSEIKVNKFEVPYMEISDHLPLILAFEV